MRRRFVEHDKRSVKDLGGIWDFAFLGEVPADKIDLEAIQFDTVMAVPGCFDATPAFAGRRGLVAYRTVVSFADNAPHRLVFDGVHHWCRAFLDGTPAGEHSGGFTRFAFDIPAPLQGEAELIVLVDNRLDAARSPLHLPHYDWYHFGGIARGVEIQRLGATWIEAVRCVTTDLAGPAIELQVDYRGASVNADASDAPTAPLVISVDGAVVWEESVLLAATAGTITRRLTLPGAALWSPDAPHLHTLHVRLGEDDLRDRVGLRQIRVEGTQLMLNDQPLRLHGFNRHESHPQFGHSQPLELLVADLQQLKELGCNFVRGSHYPQDRLWLDLCDEAGICVWSEAIGWQNTFEQLSDANFMDAQRLQIKEMVAGAHNSPAVILWGVLNEGHSHQVRNRPHYQALLECLRATDPSRPLTYASNQPWGDECFDLVDVVSINIYPGWYFGEVPEIPRLLDEIMVVLSAGAAAGKPWLISEIGAGAVPGWRDWNAGRWTEQYQALLLETVIRHLLVDHDTVAGLSIWLFNDFRTPDSVNRARSFNDKGVVDEYRRPKMAYQTVKTLFDGLAEKPAQPGLRPSEYGETV